MHKQILTIIGIVLIVLLWQWYLQQQACAQMVFMDVGQGDSFLFSTAGNATQIVVDGGKDFTVVDQLGKYMPANDKKLELVIATHPDLDHFGGLVHVLNRFEVETLLITGASLDKEINRAFFAAIKPETKVIYAHYGWEWQRQGVQVRILAPKESYFGSNQAPENANDGSVVGLVVLNGLSLFFTGDAEYDQEQELLNSNLVPKADIMHAGHHGSKTSNQQKLLERVRPEHFIVQAGRDNPYGHPHPEVIEQVVALGSTIWRTDLHGTIMFESCHVGEISSIQTEHTL